MYGADDAELTTGYCGLLGGVNDGVCERSAFELDGVNDCIAGALAGV
jgi:hypothetical protein